jgi:hypothetical protein
MAVSWKIWPTSRDPSDGLTSTLATGTGVTVTVAVPDTPSLVAVMVALPAPNPVTRPSPLTIATDTSPDVQLIALPANTFPAASFGVAVSCSVSPT